MPPVLTTRIPARVAATIVAATVVPPNPGLTIASRTVAAIARLVTLGMLRGYIQQDAAGVAELVQAHGLGPCGASHGGSSPFARTIQPHPGGRGWLIPPARRFRRTSPRCRGG